MWEINKIRFNLKVKLFFGREDVTKKASYFKSSIIAIIVGLTVGVIFVSLFGLNGFGFIFNSFVAPFKNMNDTKKVVVYFCVFALLGLGLSLGFKIKMFNMGGSGYAIAGVFTSYMILNSLVSNSSDMQNVSSIYGLPIFCFFILIGALMSSLTGIFKVLFNVHEVATSIVLNWIIWFSFKYYLLKTFGPTAANQTSPTLFQPFGDHLWIFGLVVVFISVIILWIFINKTTIGFKYKISGTQSDAAYYAGIKNKRYIIGITAFQGLFISAGGFLYFYGITGQVKMTNNILPTIGFDGIAVALVAFNNVFAVLPVALLWGILTHGVNLSQANPIYIGLPAETSYLLFGFIMYSSALYILFLKLNFYKLKDLIYLHFFDKNFTKTKLEFKDKKSIMLNNKKDLEKKVNQLSKNLKSSNIQDSKEKIDLLIVEINNTKLKVKKNKISRKKIIKQETKNTLLLGTSMKKNYLKNKNQLTYDLLEKILNLEKEYKFNIENMSNQLSIKSVTKAKIFILKLEIMTKVNRDVYEWEDKCKFQKDLYLERNSLKGVK